MKNKKTLGKLVCLVLVISFLIPIIDLSSHEVRSVDASSTNYLFKDKLYNITLDDVYDDADPYKIYTDAYFQSEYFNMSTLAYQQIHNESVDSGVDNNEIKLGDPSNINMVKGTTGSQDNMKSLDTFLTSYTSTSTAGTQYESPSQWSDFSFTKGSGTTAQDIESNNGVYSTLTSGSTIGYSYDYSSPSQWGNFDFTKGSGTTAQDIENNNGVYSTLTSGSTIGYSYDYSSPSQWGNFDFTKGSGGATGELETNNNVNYATIDSTEFSVAPDEFITSVDYTEGEYVGGSLENTWVYNTQYYRAYDEYPNGGFKVDIEFLFDEALNGRDFYISAWILGSPSGSTTELRINDVMWKNENTMNFANELAENVNKISYYVHHPSSPAYMRLQYFKIVEVDGGVPAEVDVSATWIIPDNTPLTLYYDYHTTVAVDCDLDIYNWDEELWLELQSNTGTGWITGSYGLTDPYISISNQVRVRFQTASYGSDFDLILDQLTVYYEIETPTYSFDYSITWIIPDNTPLTLYYDYKTSVSVDCDLDIYDWVAGSYNTELESNTGTGWITDIYDLEANPNKVSGSNQVRVRFQTASYSSNFYMYIDQLTVYYEIETPTYSFDYSITWIIPDNTPLTLYYDYKTSVSVDCDLDIYDWVAGSYNTELESNTGTGWITDIYDLEANPNKVSGSNQVRVRFQTASYSSNFYMYIDQLTISYIDDPAELEFTILTPFDHYNYDLLSIHIESHQKTSISQQVYFKIWNYDSTDYETISSSTETTTVMERDFNSVDPNDYIDENGVKLYWSGINTEDNFIFYIDYLLIRIYYKMDLWHEVSFDILGLWKYRWEIHGSLQYTDWTCFEVVNPEPNIELISDSNYITEWRFFNNANESILFEADTEEILTNWDYEVIYGDEVLPAHYYKDELSIGLEIGNVVHLKFNKTIEPLFIRDIYLRFFDDSGIKEEWLIASDYLVVNNKEMYINIQYNYTLTEIQFYGMTYLNLEVVFEVIDYGDYDFIKYLPPCSSKEIYLEETETLRMVTIFENSFINEIIEFYSVNTTYLIFYSGGFYDSIYLNYYDSNNDHLNFDDFKTYINYTYDDIEYTNIRLFDNILVVDAGTKVYYNIYDSFNFLIKQYNSTSQIFVDIQLDIYSLKIKNLMEQQTTVDINSTLVFPILSGELIEYILSKNYYQIGYYDTNNVYKQFLIYLNSNQAYELNRSQICILVYGDQQGNHLVFENYKTYLNGSRIYTNSFYREIGDIVGIEIKDRYDISIKNATLTVVSGVNEKYIVLTLYSLKVMNQQENFNHINITRDPNYYESDMYWSEWVAPGWVIEFHLFAGYYKINLTDNEGGSYSYYSYTLNGDDILLISSDNTISQVIYNIANVNTTIGNQITTVQIDLTNQNSEINNSIITVEINLGNINSTLGNMLINLNVDITNVANNISALYVFTNNSFINLNNNMNNSFIYMENNIISINQSISNLVIGVSNDIYLINGTISTMISQLETNLLLMNVSIDTALFDLGTTLSLIGSNITSNYILLNNSITLTNTNINDSRIAILNNLLLVNNTICDLVSQVYSSVYLINNSIYNAVLDLGVSLSLINNTIGGNLSFVLQQNNFLSELYKMTMFSELLNWTNVGLNTSLLTNQIDVWEFENKYKDESGLVLLRYNELITNLTVSAQNTLLQYLPKEGVEYRVWSESQQKYLDDWKPLPENRSVDFGFYEEEVPFSPEPIVNSYNNIIALIVLSFGIILIVVGIAIYLNKKVHKLKKKSFNHKLKATSHTRDF